RMLGPAPLADGGEASQLRLEDLVALVLVKVPIVDDEDVRVVDASRDLLPVLLSRLAAIALVVAKEFVGGAVHVLVAAVALVRVRIQGKEREAVAVALLQPAHLAEVADRVQHDPTRLTPVAQCAVQGWAEHRAHAVGRATLISEVLQLTSRR